MNEAADLISTTQPDAPVKQVPLEPRDPKPNPAESSTPKAEEQKPKLSIDDAIRKGFEKATGEKPPPRGERDDRAAPAKDEPKVEEPAAEKPKPAEATPSRERAADGKFVGKEPKEPSGAEPEQAEGSEQAGKEKPLPSEGKGRHEPPARFLPRAREAWTNVPNVVKEEIARLAAEDETASAEFREAHERDKELKPFHEQARANGTSVRQYIERTQAIQQLLDKNLLQGMDTLARQYGTDLRSIAAHVLQQPQQQGQPAPADRQLQQKIAGLERTIQELQQGVQQDRGTRVIQDVEANVVTPFRNEPGHERYAELEGHIAKFLHSGMIPDNLSPRQKLEEAYFMADRIYSAAPSQASSGAAADAPDATRVNPAGLKSVTGSPSVGMLDTSRGSRKGKEDAKDLDAVLKRAFAKGGVRASR